MPKKTKPAYSLHKATGQARCRINGKDHYLGEYGSPESRERYEDLVSEWFTRNGDTSRHTLTVDDLVLLYMEHVRQHYRKNGQPTSEVTNIRIALKYVVAEFGTTRAKDFGPRALKAARQAMIDAGCVRTSINRMTARIRGLFKWSVAEELVPPETLVAIQSLAGLRYGRSDAKEAEPVKPVPQAFIDAVEPHVSRQVWAMIQLQRLRNWANRAQWCAHELLDDVLSDESLSLLKTDRLLFLKSRWHLRKQTLASPFLDGDFEAEAVFEFIRGIGEKRGRPFCYSGGLTKCALDSATWVSENVAEIVGPPLTNWKSETVEEIEEAISELRAVIRWNPKELEEQLSEECEFAIANLRTWKTESEKVRLRLLDELDSLRNPKSAETSHGNHDAPLKHKLEVNQIAGLAILDGEPIPVTSQQALALQILLDNKGEPVSLASHGIRSREINSLPQKLQELVHPKPGGGTRILRDKVEMA